MKRTIGWLVACVALKFVLNEGVARWQLATGSTLDSKLRIQPPAYWSTALTVSGFSRPSLRW